MAGKACHVVGYATQVGLTQALGRMKEFFPLMSVAALAGISIYFWSRRNSPPSAMESRAALIWLIIRRVVCFGAAAICVAAAGAVAYLAFRTSVSVAGVAGITLALSFAYILVHWGMYGMGYRRYDVRDDKPVHELRKKRYGWPW